MHSQEAYSSEIPPEIPMEIDGGIASLEQSRHHPHAALKAVSDLTNAPENRASSSSKAARKHERTRTQTSGTSSVRELLNQLVALVADDLKNQACSIAKEVLIATEATKTSPKEGRNKETGQSWDEVRKLVVEEASEAAATAVKELLSEVKKTTGAGSTWAAVAARGVAVTAQQQELPKKVIPARQSLEMLIRGSEMPLNLARRTPQEIVQAINTASTRKGAVAARTLPSGDIVVTFKDEETRGWHKQEADWIQEAFGEQAKEAKRTVAILIKGLRKADLQGLREKDFATELGLKTVDKVKFRLPSMPEHTRATVFLALTDQEEARKACDNGLVWRAQIFNCEPYSAMLDATQCYKCWQWGHTQRYCRKEPLCPRCGTHVHGNGGKEGEALCPTHKGTACRCPTCGGPHTAWAKECAKGVQAKLRAKEAYQYRPRSFQPLQRERPKAIRSVATELAILSTPSRQTTLLPPRTQPQNILPNHYSDEGEDEGFQEVRRKRGRGRPTGLENAAQSPTQRRLMFPSTAKTQPPPDQLTTAQPESQNLPMTDTQPAEITTQQRL